MRSCYNCLPAWTDWLEPVSQAGALFTDWTKMELPRRHGDELLPLGEMTDIRRRLKSLAAGQDLSTVIACAFDHRTRMLPFIYADLRMVPAGVRALGAELFESGFEKTRIVLQHWNRNFRPSEGRLDGRLPDLLCLSTMQMHWDPCKTMIRDACRIDPDERPLVLVGGPKAIYEPWDAFSTDPNDPWAADLVVTGESYVLLSVLKRLLTVRGKDEPLRKAYLRARDQGVLDDIPGLVYANGPADGPPEELVDTGIQQLCGDLNEMAGVVTPYRLLNPPGRGRGLSSQPLPASRIKRYNPLSSLVLTLGCRFGCKYCPIPGYNQRQYRTKNGERIVDEIRDLHMAFGIRNYFGTDDNFFNDHERTANVLETMMNAKIGDKMLRHCARIGTETTIHDGWELRHLLPMARK
ncbi:MAG: B12-binding domain-containing radical SAM protein, partial [Planctomycetota bacterium]